MALTHTTVTARMTLGEAIVKKPLVVVSLSHFCMLFRDL